jgi:hypothetical protein
MQTAILAVGFGLLVGYLIQTRDWGISVGWALVFPLISFSVARATVALKLHARLPGLNRYVLYPVRDGKTEPPLTDREWTIRQVNWLINEFRGKGVFLTPGEDALICVPVLLVGIHPLSAFLGGVAFGVMHLARFTYLDCIAKGSTYALVCYFVLPQGLLTVVLGHFIMNGIGFAVLQVAKRQMERLQAVERKLELRSNRTVDADAHDTAARRSP